MSRVTLPTAASAVKSGTQVVTDPGTLRLRPLFFPVRPYPTMWLGCLTARYSTGQLAGFGGHTAGTPRPGGIAMGTER